MNAPQAPLTPLQRLRAATQARIGLGRHGAGLPTRAMLDFQLAHASARDAVYAQLRADEIRASLAKDVVEVHSQAANRQVFLQRPDLGRRLQDACAGRLKALAPPRPVDAVIVLADGLSATACQEHGAAVAAELAGLLPTWNLAPLVLAHQARVALADEIGELLRARLAVMLIGERPGLSAPNSLGAYITWNPRPGRVDSERNCVSNIRPPHGLSHRAAALKIAWLVQQASARRLSGTALKDEHAGLPSPQIDSH